MKSWKRNLEYLNRFNDITLQLMKSKDFKMDSQLQQVNRVFLIKFQNNIMACTPFVEELMLNRVTILSVGLI